MKTYLPDGDIDLTAFGSAAPDSTLISDVRCILEYEEQNSDAEFEVKDVQYINAEVRFSIGFVFYVVSFDHII